MGPSRHTWDPQGIPRDPKGPPRDLQVTPKGPPSDPQGTSRDPKGPLKLLKIIEKPMVFRGFLEGSPRDLKGPQGMPKGLPSDPQRTPKGLPSDPQGTSKDPKGPQDLDPMTRGPRLKI